MEFNEFKELFHEELFKNNIENSINDEKFFKYMKLLLEWNEKINLTAIKDEKEFVIKHFIDSLSINKYVKEKDKLIDIGTGAGFPGIPLKLFHKELSVILLDSVRKKVDVLKDVVEKLELKDVNCVHARAEDFAKDNREIFDIAVSRAVANMSTLVEYLIPFVKLNGIIVCMKGFYIDEELERNIIVIKKIKETPKKYPRGQSKPLKEPIS